MIYVLSGGGHRGSESVAQAFTSLEKAQAYCSRLTDPWKETHIQDTVFWTAVQRDALKDIGGEHYYWRIDLVKVD